MLTRLEEEETPIDKKFEWEANIGMNHQYAFRLYMSAHPSIVDQLFTGKFIIANIFRAAKNNSNMRIVQEEVDNL